MNLDHHAPGRPQSTSGRLLFPFSSRPDRLWLLVSLAVTAAVHAPMLFTFFFADDFLHLYQIANWRPLEFIFSSHGGHLYIFRNAVFYVMFKLFGLQAGPYFTIVLLTHLLGCTLLFKVLQLLTGKPLAATAGTMLWGTSPLLHATMAWYSVYGHVLAGLFFLLFFHDLVRVNQGLLSFSPRLVLRWSAYIVLMAASFGHGLAAAGLAPATAWLVLWRSDRKWRIAASLMPAVAVVVVLYAAKDTLYAMAGGPVPQSGAMALRDATQFVLPIAEMTLRMMAYAFYCATAVPLFISSAMEAYPNAAIFSFPPLALLLAWLFFRSGKYRTYYAAMVMLLLGSIALNAYGRAPFYTMIHMPMHHAAITHRYYYIILMLAVILLVLMADDLLDGAPRASNIIMPVVATALIVIATAAHHMVKKLEHESLAASQNKIYTDTKASIDASIQAALPGQTVFIDNTMPEKFFMFFPSETDFPGKAAVFAITHPHNIVDGRRVFFVEPDCRVADLNLAYKDWRISSLMVSACDKELFPERTKPTDPLVLPGTENPSTNR